MAEYLTTKELCSILKVSNVTIHNYRKEGMPYEKWGTLVRFDKDKVMLWLQNRNKESNE